MAEKLVTAYDTRTGKKLDRRVPAVWLRLFPYLSLTPQTKAAGTAGTVEPDGPADDVPEADSPEDAEPTPKTAPRRRTTKKES